MSDPIHFNDELPAGIKNGSECEEKLLFVNVTQGAAEAINEFSLNKSETFTNGYSTTTESEVSSTVEDTEVLAEKLSPQIQETNAFELYSLRFKNRTVLNFADACLHNMQVDQLRNILHEFFAKAKQDVAFVEVLTIDKDEDIRNSQKNEILALREICKQLESKNTHLAHSVKQLKEKLDMCDINSNQTMTMLQKDLDMKISELKKKCKIAEAEKQTAVMDYARREKDLLDLHRQKEDAEQLARNAVKDRDKVIAQAKVHKSDLSKIKISNEKNESGNIVQNKEIDRLKEEINSQVIKVRWAQNKLKAEVDSHKETKEKCDKLLLEIQHAKEETEHLRQNCQEMIKTYQESEEMKSNALDIKLQEKMSLLSEKETEILKLSSTLKQRNDDFLLLKKKHKDICNDYQDLKSKATRLDQESIKNQSVLREYEKIMNSQKATASDMNAKMQQIFDLQNQVEELSASMQSLNESLDEAISQRNSALNDLVSKERKEQELLVYTEKVTSKNTLLTVEVEEIKTKLLVQSEELSNKDKLIEDLQNELNRLETTREEEKTINLDTKTTLNSRLEEKDQTICDLLLQLEELKDDIRTMKRKNAASVKDLSRQLDIARRKTDNTETFTSSSIFAGKHQNPDNESLGSPVSSSSSDRMSPSSAGQTLSFNNGHVPVANLMGQDSPYQQLLIERIVRLQQVLAAKDEKMDFINEHVNQLVESLKKKQHLLQHYMLKEKSGALAPPCEDTDIHKRYGLTVEETNRRMQSVLEDTLLKNITLKENLKILGEEVKRLSSPPIS